MACMRAAAVTPDALEHWVDHCRQQAAVTVRAHETAYAACMRTAAGTRDSLEHRVGSCRERPINASHEMP